MKKALKTIICVLIFAALILGYFFYLSNWDHGSAEDKVEEETEIEKILDQDLDNDYPKTPREVIKFNNRILMCYYNMEVGENDFEKLVLKQKELLDDELKENNPDYEMVAGVRADVLDYKKDSRVIKSANVCSSSEVIYKTVDGRECAYVMTSYFLKDKDGFTSTKQRYVLRKDSEGKWKIITFYLISSDDIEN